MKDDLLFELRGPDGEQWKLYLSGVVEGFPPGTFVVNHASPLVNRLIGEVNKHAAPFSANQAHSVFV